MNRVKVETRDGEEHISIEREEGLTVDELRLLLGALPLSMGDKPISLCLNGVETYTTRIVRANNEGDDSTLWLHVSAECEQEIASGLGDCEPASVFFNDFDIDNVTLVRRDGAVYVAHDGRETLLGEFDDEEFVPSKLLLISTGLFQEWVDDFVRG